MNFFNFSKKKDINSLHEKNTQVILLSPKKISNECNDFCRWTIHTYIYMYTMYIPIKHVETLYLLKSRTISES